MKGSIIAIIILSLLILSACASQTEDGNETTTKTKEKAESKQEAKSSNALTLKQALEKTLAEAQSWKPNLVLQYARAEDIDEAGKSALWNFELASISGGRCLKRNFGYNDGQIVSTNETPAEASSCPAASLKFDSSDIISFAEGNLSYLELRKNYPLARLTLSGKTATLIYRGSKYLDQYAGEELCKTHKVFIDASSELKITKEKDTTTPANDCA